MDDLSHRRAEIDGRISKLTRQVQHYLDNVSEHQEKEATKSELSRMKRDLDAALGEKEELNSTLDKQSVRIKHLVRA